MTGWPRRRARAAASAAGTATPATPPAPGPVSAGAPLPALADEDGGRAAALAASQGLPLVSAEGLTRRQRKGNSCASCRKRFPSPSVAAGVTPAGEVLMRCPECVVVFTEHGSQAGDEVPHSGRGPAAPDRHGTGSEHGDGRRIGPASLLPGQVPGQGRVGAAQDRPGAGTAAPEAGPGRRQPGRA